MIFSFHVVSMPESPKINIIYEDNHLLVVEKPINIPVQADASKDIDMITILKKYRKEKENKSGQAFIGLIHRLDRPVGGVMVFAKTSKAASRLSDQIRKNTFQKIYLAVIKGSISSAGELEDYLIKDKHKNISYITNSKNGKFSKLKYEVLDTKNNMSLVKIHLLTGRSHQIRLQFASRKHPLIGDSKYGSNPNNINIALFASSLSFNHPITKERLTFTLNKPERYPFNIFK